MEKKHPFEPVYDKDSKILILGSMPSLESTKKGFYYMHPQNRFWKILSIIYKQDVYLTTIEEKKKFLLKHHIALYDVIASCTITLSSDASIKNVQCTKITELIAHSCISKILLNGTKAYQLFIKEYPEYKNIAICLPSTSSANAKCSLLELVSIWQSALLSRKDLL